MAERSLHPEASYVSQYMGKILRKIYIVVRSKQDS